jgi:putative Holliday junction resolvase
MPRIMGLDVGEKTVGVAVSDETGMLASPLVTIERTDSIKADLREVVRLMEEHDVSKVVIGIPIMLSGEEAVQAAKVREFGDRLAKRVRVPVEYWDERLSTVQAHRVLIETGKTREERRQIVDKVAAAIILQGYIEGTRTED